MAEDSAARTENRPRLGRGLAALLGGVNAQHSEAPRAARQTPIEFLRPNPRNPRKRFDDAELTVLLYDFKEDLNRYLADLGSGSPIHTMADAIA